MKDIRGQYKLIALDVDGTLLDDNGKISQRNKNALKMAQKAGVYVSLCSGRSIVGLYKILAELDLNDPQFAIVFNGGEVYNHSKSELLRHVTTTPERAMEILKIAKQFAGNTDIIGYVNHGEVCFEKMTPYVERYMRLYDFTFRHGPLEQAVLDGACKFLFMGPTEELIEIQKHVAPVLPSDFNLFFSSPYLLEITPPGATKGEGLEFLCDYLNISPSEAIGMGDQMNDMSLIETAGLGVAMANAQEALKEKADFITSSNNDSGVALVVERFIL